MQRLLYFCLFLFPVLLGAQETPQFSIQVDGLERTYLIHEPESLPEGEDVRHPLVLAFHGGGGNATSMVRISGLNAKADQERFIVVYPSGTGRIDRMLTFNGGICCGYAMENEIDDVAFVDALLDKLIQEEDVDPKRVYATGLSNGGIVSYYLASKLADRITAIASVAGTMGTETCNPSRPVPIMHIHGTDDQFLDYNGGFGKNSVSRTNFFSVDHTIQEWTAANQCEGEPMEEDLPDSAEDGCTVKRITYTPKEGGAEVVLIKIENGGHTWPGGSFSPSFLGRLCQDVSANDLMWDFFKRHAIE